MCRPFFDEHPITHWNTANKNTLIDSIQHHARRGRKERTTPSEIYATLCTTYSSSSLHMVAYSRPHLEDKSLVCHVAACFHFPRWPYSFATNTDYQPDYSKCG